MKLLLPILALLCACSKERSPQPSTNDYFVISTSDVKFTNGTDWTFSHMEGENSVYTNTSGHAVEVFKHDGRPKAPDQTNKVGTFGPLYMETPRFQVEHLEGHIYFRDNPSGPETKWTHAAHCPCFTNKLERPSR